MTSARRQVQYEEEEDSPNTDNDEFEEVDVRRSRSRPGRRVNGQPRGMQGGLPNTTGLPPLLDSLRGASPAEIIGSMFSGVQFRGGPGLGENGFSLPAGIDVEEAR